MRERERMARQQPKNVSLAGQKLLRENCILWANKKSIIFIDSHNDVFLANFFKPQAKNVREGTPRDKMAATSGVLVCGAIVSPFPFYWALWNYPQVWVRWCGPEVDPCHRMALFSHLLKLAQLAALFSVSTFSWPPFYCWIFIALGQFLNFRVYQLLGEDGVYYGVRFGKNIPWVHEFPFGYMRDPQYIGSTLCLAGCFFWVPWQYLLLWSTCYLLMSLMEGKEDVLSRAKPMKA